MFNPGLDSKLVIDGEEFRFSPHPAVPSIVWGQEGRHAIVYRLQSNGSAYALKVFRPVFRHEGLAEAADSLWIYHELPGMRVCQQRVFTPDTYDYLIAQHEDLEYAMLMPWIDGPTWFDMISQRNKVSLDQSRLLADSMAWVLYALELNNLAHCDLSSGNVIIDPQMDRIHLIDVEDLYSPWLARPPYVPAGTMGYQHHAVAKTGQWGPLGDRFAGAVLLAEMLAWAHPDIRKKAWGESYFAPNELQQDNERYELLRDVLRIYNPGFAEAFEQAWRSRDLDACPPIKTWYDLLDKLPREPVAEWAPIDPAIFAPPAPEPLPSPPVAVTKKQPPVVQIETKDNKTSGCLKGCSTGCRQLFFVSMVVMLLACYAGIFFMLYSFASQ